MHGAGLNRCSLITLASTFICRLQRGSLFCVCVSTCHCYVWWRLCVFMHRVKSAFREGLKLEEDVFAWSDHVPSPCGNISNIQSNWMHFTWACVHLPCIGRASETAAAATLARRPAFYCFFLPAVIILCIKSKRALSASVRLWKLCEDVDTRAFGSERTWSKEFRLLKVARKCSVHFLLFSVCGEKGGRVGNGVIRNAMLSS